MQAQTRGACTREIITRERVRGNLSLNFDVLMYWRLAINETANFTLAARDVSSFYNDGTFIRVLTVRNCLLCFIVDKLFV